MGKLSSTTSPTPALMNDRLSATPTAAAGGTPPAESADLALPRGLRLGAFEIQRVLARSASSIVYLATDHALAMPVALQEYLPARLTRRDTGLLQRAAEPWQDDVIDRGRRAFIDETRLLAGCDHPALVRVTQLFEALGSAYRVMPVYTGPRLSDVRSKLLGAPKEVTVRALLDQLLGAVEAIHRSGQVHGGIAPTNILLLADDRPLLLGAGAATREIGSDLVDSLMATLELGAAAQADAAPAAAPPVGAARDLYMLADTLRFYITGEAPTPAGTLRPREPLAEAIARAYAPEVRPHYSAALLGTLDASLSTFAEDRPLTAAQFRDWLVRGVPGGAVRVAPVAAAAPPAPFAPPTASPATRSPKAVPIDAATAFDPNPPIPPWPAAATGLTGDAITPERPPWMQPPLPPELRQVANVRARQRKLSIAAGAAGLAVVGLAAVALWWSAAPEIQIELTAAPAIPTTVETAASRAPDAPVTAEPAAAAPPPPPVVAQAASTEAPPAAPAPAPATEPVPTASVSPPDAEQDSSARPVRGSNAASTNEPRTACASRTEFALYRCMVQQCQVKRWVSHPQCVKLRRDDRVD